MDKGGQQKAAKGQQEEPSENNYYLQGKRNVLCRYHLEGESGKRRKVSWLGLNKSNEKFADSFHDQIGKGAFCVVNFIVIEQKGVRKYTDGYY